MVENLMSKTGSVKVLSVAEDMKNATERLVDDLRRISITYAKEKSTWLYKIPGSRQD